MNMIQIITFIIADICITIPVTILILVVYGDLNRLTNWETEKVAWIIALLIFVFILGVRLLFL